jgi:light-regulated signal transduction histidine kinase (bacteriophytochrome)
MPRSRELERSNRELEREITLRIGAELDLRASYQELEERVRERTRELSQANERLTQEIQERERTEQALLYSETLLRRLHDSLEDHITELTAELTRTIAELEAFSYSISHDLRAPLRAINGYAAILSSEHAAGLDMEGRDLLDRVALNAGKMAQLIDGLLDFSRLARAECASSDVDMTALVSGVATELQGAHGRDMHMDIGELPRAQGNEAMLRQVWTNLVSNALKFSSRESRSRVEIRGARSGAEVTYSVRDNGVGFDMAYAEKLFGVFNRLHSAGEFPGVGVGLAIVRRIVQRHGGRVWAESREGEGSTFYFTLPVKGGDATRV